MTELTFAQGLVITAIGSVLVPLGFMVKDKKTRHLIMGRSYKVCDKTPPAYVDKNHHANSDSNGNSITIGEKDICSGQDTHILTVS